MYQPKTFDQADTVKAVTIGFDKQEPQMDPKLWTEDFTNAWTGRSYTLNIPKKTEPEYKDELFIHFDQMLRA